MESIAEHSVSYSMDEITASILMNKNAFIEKTKLQNK